MNLGELATAAGALVAGSIAGGIALSTPSSELRYKSTWEADAKILQEVQKANRDYGTSGTEQAKFYPVELSSPVHLTDVQNINIYAYGLLTSYKGELFTASKRMIELCDKIVQISNGMRCWCGDHATHNALYLGGHRANSGNETVVDNTDGIDYRVMCRKHFLEHIEYNSKRDTNV